MEDPTVVETHDIAGPEREAQPELGILRDAMQPPLVFFVGQVIVTHGAFLSFSPVCIRT